ncbi:MAG: LysM peptidoglycan-binding domain-containing protein [Cyclobacteriaceae bacterium]
MRFLLLLSTSLILSQFSEVTATPADSLGMVQDSRGSFIRHEVEIGQTLFAISRKYNVKVSEITDLNPEAAKALRAGEVLLIPLKPAVNQVVKTNGSGGIQYHTVQPSETLYSISRQYNLSLNELRELNNLSGDALSPGDRLVVGKKSTTSNEPIKQISDTPEFKSREIVKKGQTHEVQASETLYAISRMYNVPATDIQKWNGLSGAQLSIGQVIYVSEPAIMAISEKPTTTTPQRVEDTTLSVRAPKEPPTKKIEDVDVKRISENGMAENIGGSSDSRKYLALHRTAPVGTIIQVRNDTNDQSVFVRVIGRIPNTGDNAKVLIKLSNMAYERLGAVGDRFPVTISYIP